MLAQAPESSSSKDAKDTKENQLSSFVSFVSLVSLDELLRGGYGDIAVRCDGLAARQFHHEHRTRRIA